MRIFVFEYVTGGGCPDESMVANLAVEGDLMLGAVVRDMVDVEGVEVLVCRDRRLKSPQVPVEVFWVDGDWRLAWSWCLASADAVLPIAPETEGVLESLCRDVEMAGKLLLNSSADAVTLAADKQLTLDRLGRRGIPVVPSWRADSLPPFNDSTLVVKPNRGVGCRDIHLVKGERELRDFLMRQRELSRWLVQHYVEGQSASLSLLVGNGCVCLLGCNLQRVAQVDDGFALLGCVVNGLTQSRDELHRLAEDICRTIPGLWGYVGVDFIMTKTGPVVLEVNPRLTTCYAGLTRSTGWNIAELLIRLVHEPKPLSLPQLHGESVHVDLELGRVA